MILPAAFKILFVGAVAWGVFGTVGLAQTPPPTPTQLEPVLAQLATYEHGQNGEPIYQLTLLVEDAVGSPARAAQLESRLLQFLQSEATTAGKQAACEQLSLIATEKSIPVLSGMLPHAETAEMARYALARIPGPKADAALRNGLSGASASLRIGIINSLGQRRDASAVPALRPLLSASDTGTARAAADALGDIGTHPALEALEAARQQASGPLRQAMTEAYLKCAGRVAAGGNRNAALHAYQQLLADQPAPMIRVAALHGLAALEGKSALPAISAAMAASEQPVRMAAIELVARIPGRESTAALMDRFAGATADDQVRLLAALAGHGDPAARPLLERAAKSDTAAVRAAALEGLGKLGNESSIALLAEAAASGPGAEQNAARQSLYGLSGPAIDSAIVSALGGSSGKVKVELILAAGERGTTAAADALVQAAREPDPEVRRSALRALRNVAGPAQVPALIETIRTADAAAQRDATQALAAALKRSLAAQMDAVVAAYRETSTVEVRLALIDAMGQVSSREALPLLRDCLHDPNPEIARGAILALTAWADPSPLPDLLAVAKGNADPALQILALRGCLKLIALPSDRAVRQSAQLLAQVILLARQPAEKKAVLALLPVYACDEALQAADASTADPAVANEAKASMERIRLALKHK